MRRWLQRCFMTSRKSRVPNRSDTHTAFWKKTGIMTAVCPVRLESIAADESKPKPFGRTFVAQNS